jgi:heavy metal translocating P-type ATPase
LTWVKADSRPRGHPALLDDPAERPFAMTTRPGLLRALTPDRILLGLTLAALLGGTAAWALGAAEPAHAAWGLGTGVVLTALLAAIARDLWHGRTGVDLLAAFSMAGALLLGEHLAGIIVALMYAGGTALEAFAERRAGAELTALLGRAPREAHRERDGALEVVPVEQVAVGDRLLVRTGEAVPVDGAVLDGPAILDEAALTGEPLPVEHAAGERVRSGALNAGAPFSLRAIATAEASTYAGIVRLVADAREQKAPFVRMADRYSLLFLPATLLVATAAWLLTGDPARALAVLVVATPCPLILAAPVAMVAGISAAARRGVLVKGGGALETLARAEILVLDKTGTLTTGTPRVTSVETKAGMAEDELLRLAASLDQASTHPLAEALLAAARARGLPLTLPEAVRETPGAGIEGRVEGREIRLGRIGFVLGGSGRDPWIGALARRAARDGATTVLVAVDGAPVGAILLADEIRAETPRALRTLHQAGIHRTVLLSGDRLDAAETVAAALGIDAVLAERTPEDKVDAVRAERQTGVTAMVGDGINDAPALAAADIGIAMGARGAAAASEAADAVLLVDQLDRLAEAMGLARRTRRVALESVLAGMALSGLGMVAAAFGFLPPVAGALVQEAIDVAVILNALRALAPAAVVRRKDALPLPELRRLHEGHAVLDPILDRLRALADRLDLGGDGQELLAELRAVDRLLQEEVLPHERADEAELHPKIALLLGGRDPMASISRTHREIAHLARRLHRLVAGLPEDGPSHEELVELRRILYGLEAILRLHFAQENEIYDSVAGEPAAGAAPRTRVAAQAG